ncbi:Transcription factor/ CAP family protein [Giardia duodenalis assemblage B]|uniref:Transcription factor/ CAP family protein n=1 Tax=Giardia duodenalis assemblage B TaxID=1394984 RepID=A0A132NYE8_GIAIN|nr:Transcription factor/ CAP family protein [Giardia intestinalis assemblage B]
MASQNEDDPMKNRRIVQRPEQDLASLLIEALRKDAHCQESHRKLDEYLSTHQVNMAFRECLLALLEDMPEDPFAAIVYRLCMIKRARDSEQVISLDCTAPHALRLDNVAPDDQILNLIKTHPHLSSLSPQLMSNLRAMFVLKEFPPGSTLYKVDEPTDGLVFILFGKVFARYRNGDAAILGVGQFFGEQCCLPVPGKLHFTASVYDPLTDKPTGVIQEGPRMGTPEASAAGQPTKVCIAVLPRVAYIKMIFNQRRSLLSGAAIVHYLKNKFTSLTDDETSFVASLGEVRIFAKGEPLVSANEVTNCLLVVIDGYGDGFQEGTIFGCEAVFIGKGESRTAICETATECVAIPADELKARGSLFHKMAKVL